MQLDRFYRFSTIKRFVRRSAADPIRVIVDIGANVGDALLLLHRHFPRARIIGFEPVLEYFQIAAGRVAAIREIELHNKAVTAQHLFFDDLGAQPRPCQMSLAIVKALPEAGSGWRGGSLVGPEDHKLLAAGISAPGYQRISQPVTPITLAEIFAMNGIDEIDLLKIDCEGCESSVLGCADGDLMRRVRFITGEYHGWARFYPVMRDRLFPTHKVFLTGNMTLGSFLAERRHGETDGLLCHRTSQAPIRGADDQQIECNPFGEMPAWHSRFRSAGGRPHRQPPNAN
jgi:FkbM family methyltransferase